MQTAVLHPAQRTRGSLPQRRHTVQRAIKKLLVAKAQEYPLRYPVQRTGDQPIVGLVDIIFAGEQAVQTLDPAAQPVGTRSVAAEQECRSETADSSTIELLIRSLAFHNEALAVNGFFRAHSNHGIYQA